MTKDGRWKMPFILRGPVLYGSARSKKKCQESRSLLHRVLGIQYLDQWRACTLFLLLRRLSSEETRSTRLTHDLGD